MENNRNESGTTNEAVGQASVVFMDHFRFDSLSKHMKPFYADLIRHENANDEQKAEIRRKVCVNFYRRVREYRGLTVDRTAEICRVSSDEIQALERGDKEHEKWLIGRFIRACGADLEYEVFFQKLLEFKDPRARASVRDVAIPALKQWGIIIPGVNYKNLNSKEGNIVPLFSESEAGSAGNKNFPPKK